MDHAFGRLRFKLPQSAKGGIWTARFRGNDDRRLNEAPGAADDKRGPDGLGCSVSRKRKISCGLGLIGEHGSKWEDFAPTDRSYAVADALLISCDKSYTARDISVAFPKNGLILSGKRPRTVSNVGLTRVWSNLTANRRRSEAWGFGV